MKILFVCTHNPYLAITGSHQRSNIILNELKSFSDVDVLIFDRNGEGDIIEKENIFYFNFSNKFSTKSKILKKIIQFFKFIYPVRKDFILKQDKSCNNIINSKLLMIKYDFVFFRYLSSYLICGNINHENIIIDIDDLPWQNSKLIAQNKQHSLLKRLYNQHNAFFTKYHFEKIINKIHLIFLSNQNDCIYPNSTSLPNIPFTDELKVTVNRIKTPNIIFVGSLKHIPNAEGLDHFISNIWPKITEVNPQAKLHIVGAGLSKSLTDKWKTNKSIQLHGFVKKIDSIYNICSIAITPIYSGAGTNIKLLEALYMEKICIASEFSIRGFESYFHNNESLFIARNDSEFIEKLNYALKNINQLERIERKGKQTVTDNFSIKTVKYILQTKLVN